MSNSSEPEKVFISYSHDSQEHIDKALDLANRLREDGVDATLDQYVEAPTEGWPRWMDRQIHKSDFVLVVGSELYSKRLLGEVDETEGLGAKWEGAILYQNLYERGAESATYIPIIFTDSDQKFIPTPMRGLTRYLVDSEQGYEKLYRRITSQPKLEKPRLGKRKELPTIDTKPGGNMYISSPIDVDLWNKAEWQGTFFITGDEETQDFEPRIGLGFRNEKYAKEIFSNWHARYGNNDSDEEIRVSIVEGDINGEEDGYSVHISPNIQPTYKKLSKKNKMDENDIFFSISRINRMNPAKGSENLDRFKVAYKKSKIYYLLPGKLDETRTRVIPFPELEIRKGIIHFRNIDEIGENDEDAPVLKTGSKKRSKV